MFSHVVPHLVLKPAPLFAILASISLLALFGQLFIYPNSASIKREIKVAPMQHWICKPPPTICSSKMQAKWKSNFYCHSLRNSIRAVFPLSLARFFLWRGKRNRFLCSLSRKLGRLLFKRERRRERMAERTPFFHFSPGDPKTPNNNPSNPF